MAEDQEHQEANYGLLVSVTDDTPSFVHRFEAGGLWERMERGETPIELGSAHEANREVHARMASHWGYDVEWKSMDTPFDVYAVATFTKTRAARARPNPRGLRIVHTEEQQ